MFFLVMKTHKKLAIVKDGKISGQSNFNYIYVLYNRILSARLKGLKKRNAFEKSTTDSKKKFIYN